MIYISLINVGKCSKRNMDSMILVIYPQLYKLNLLSEANNLQVVP